MSLGRCCFCAAVLIEEVTYDLFSCFKGDKLSLILYPTIYKYTRCNRIFYTPVLSGRTKLCTIFDMMLQRCIRKFLVELFCDLNFHGNIKFSWKPLADSIFLCQHHEIEMKFCHSVSQSVSQPASQPASQPVSQSVSQSVSQPASQPASQSVSQSVSHTFILGFLYLFLYFRVSMNTNQQLKTLNETIAKM